MDLFEALKYRLSERKFVFDSIDDKVLEKIKQHIDEIVPVCNDIRFHIDLIDVFKDRRYISNFYKRAPYYISILGECTDRSYINAGFLIEQLSVYLTSLGISSCILAANSLSIVEMEGMKPIVLMAFGHGRKMPYRDSKYAYRKDIKKISNGYENASDLLKEMSECARLAPSAYNSQPWRMEIHDDIMDVFSVKSFGISDKLRMISMGAMLANIFIVADYRWQDIYCTLRECESDKFRKAKYTYSICVGKGINHI